MGAPIEGAQAMRDTIVGVALAIVFLALIFAAPRFLPTGVEGITRADIARIGAGFAGTEFIGPWSLACSAASAVKTPSQTGPATPSASQKSVGRCRMARGYRDRNGQLVLAVAFRFAGPAKVLTMIVRYPPSGRKGQYVTVGLSHQTSLRLPIYDCAKQSCVAVGALIPAAESLLLGSPDAQVVLPPQADGKQYTIGIRLDGLAAALAVMHRADP
jgi:invasion protein IalB